MVRSLHGLLFVLVAAALTFAAGVSAQAVPLPVPVHVAAQSASASGLQSVVTFDARHLGSTTAANAGYYSRPVLVSNNTLAGAAKGLARRTAPALAFTAALAAAGWVIDELTNQIQTPGSEGAPIPPGSVYYSIMLGSTTRHYRTREAMGAAALSHHNALWGAAYPATHIEYSDAGGYGSIMMYARPWASAYDGQRIASAPEGLSEPGVDPVPVSNSQLADLIKNNPSTWNDALRNADGSVNRSPDVMAAAQSLANSLSNPDPAQQPAPDQEWDTGNQAGDSPAAAAGEWPGFCSWATMVCEWLDWSQEPLYEDGEDEWSVPVVDPLADAPTWTSGLGNGVCPAPRSVDTFVGVVEIPFDIFCELAELLRGLVLAAAYLTAAFILLGVRRG